MSKTDTTAKSKNSMATFFKVLRFIGKYRFLLVLSVILAAVTVILQLYVPVLFGYAIDEVVAAHEVDFTRMGFYLSRILVMIVFSGIATWIMSVINNRIADIRMLFVCHIGVLRLLFFGLCLLSCGLSLCFPCLILSLVLHVVVGSRSDNVGGRLHNRLDHLAHGVDDR